jgi:hypothetical protein
VGLAAWSREWARLERTAVSLCTYECRLVPGLLQSEEYAWAVFGGTIPVVTDERLETLLAARAERQRMLVERPTTLFSFIVEEHVFRRRFGDAEAMRRMLDHVLELTSRRNVTLQVVPLDPALPRAWMDRCDCWRRRSGGSDTPKGSRAADSSPMRMR